MDTIVRVHNGLHSSCTLNFRKVCSSYPCKINQQNSYTKIKFRTSGTRPLFLQTRPKTCMVVRASSSTLLELVPEVKKQESLQFELPLYDPSKQVPMDLVVVGGGPAGLAVAQQVSEAGMKVCCIDPSPQNIWPNNYGVWVDEFEALDLLDCLDTTWSGAVVYVDDNTKKLLDRPYGRVNRRQLKSKMMKKCIANDVQFHRSKVRQVVHEGPRSMVLCSDGVALQASVVLDATGFSRCLVEYDKPYDPGYQVAYGIFAEVDGHPFDVDKMVFMDWRDDHLRNDPILRGNNERTPTFLYAMPFSPTRIFLEETSLVARPGVSMEEIQKRIVARLRHLDINVKRIEEDERCYIPMGGPLPVIPQRVVGIGGTAGMVHPSTGYMVARTLAAAPILASSVVKYLGSEKRLIGHELSAEVWKNVWPMDRRRQREFFCFGMDILLKLDLKGTRRFFNAFFDLEPYHWHGFLSSRLFLPDLLVFGLALFAHASNVSRLEIMAKGTLPLLKMINNLLRERE
uniref:lycopene beta-cyclase n=1 Tax=Wollemia nobilis TaxID=56998 RepID=A0A0C9QVY0_9CONI